jgi:hypothetical protein
MYWMFAKEWRIKTSVFEATNKQCVGPRTTLSRMAVVFCTKPDYAGARNYFNITSTDNIWRELLKFIISYQFSLRVKLCSLRS